MILVGSTKNLPKSGATIGDVVLISRLKGHGLNRVGKGDFRLAGATDQ